MGTRLLLPHVYVDSVVRDLVYRYAPHSWEVVPVWTDPDQPTAYHDAVVAEWAQPDDLVIVEQDCAVGPETFPGFTSCPGWVCAPGNYAAGRVQPTTACVRFRAELKAEVPDLAERARTLDDADDMPPGDWRRIDVRLFGVARSYGHPVCVHEPQVLHLRDYTQPRRTS